MSSHDDVATQATPLYPDVSSQPNFPEIEEAILAKWERDGIFKESLAQRTGDEFVFYDGPPFANGLPHYGHLLTGYIKDIIPRFQTMRGKRVERRFGWDCHGLPAEMGTEKELGISGRKNIMEFGIGKFNAHCRETVMRYAGEWESYVKRQARWVDFEGGYKTMDSDYMESVMWAFKQLYEKGLLYESYRVMPYSWAAESPVSNFETRMDNSYRERQDPALTVRFRLAPEADELPTEIVIWTTTPWTLPSNLALCVGPEISYAILEKDGLRTIIGDACVGKYASELEGWDKVGEILGKELEGRRYEPLFPYFAGHENAFQVITADYVDTAEGTGVVHMAPGFGEDDQAICREHEIEVVCPVDHQGRFTQEVTDWAGVNVLEANKLIIKALKERGVVLRHETYLHNYPHCWRTDEPLIYRAVSSWYVKVTDFRDRMVELNQEINWIPGHIRDGQFGRWLEGARDWSISRNRFWGSPIPVWKSDDPAYPRIDVYGSLDELEADFGVRPTDLHRPAIDELTRPNPDDPTGKSTMRRVEEVLDGWFESGSMPYAQVHYPFENTKWFEQHFPSDFIVEYVAQTRGWFYTMMVLSTALFDRPPFQNCICHGVITDASGSKLSKRLRNYPEPTALFDVTGSDALRWFLCSSSMLMRAGNLQMDLKGKGVHEVVRLVLNPIWNAYHFFCLYGNADKLQAKLRTDQTGLLDRYLLAKTHRLIVQITGALDAYDIPTACQDVRLYLDALNNWWIRRSRQRFWKSEQDQDKQDAYDTLYSALVMLSRLNAPLLPLVSEALYTGLTGERSVHLTDWPSADEMPADDALVDGMDRVRQVASTALALRDEQRLRIRLPLTSLTIAGEGSEQLTPFFELIKDELNVKEVRTADRLEDYGQFELKLNARALGPKVGKSMKSLLAATREGRWSMADGEITVEERVLEEGEYELQLKPKKGSANLAVQALSSNDMICALDTTVHEELEAVGTARDVVRLVQDARKAIELEISDHIQIRLYQLIVSEAGGASYVECDESIKSAVKTHKEYILNQTLGNEITWEVPSLGLDTPSPIGDSVMLIRVDRNAPGWTVHATVRKDN